MTELKTLQEIANEVGFPFDTVLSGTDSKFLCVCMPNEVELAENALKYAKALMAELEKNQSL